jgi:DNA (cytosine-5)-methyltransferase 1
MTHGSLFSGIGGFDLAAEWMGWTNVFHCEINEFGQKILKYYWPDAKSHNDIKTTDFSIYRGLIDVLSGGFPCQPYSTAGKRLGKEDERHLWPEMLRAIREIQPRYVVGENVRGLTNWNGGVVFDEVQADLEAEGYEVLPFLLPACGVNAPHRRDRIWFIAYRENCGQQRKEGFDEREEHISDHRRGIRNSLVPVGESGNVANSNIRSTGEIGGDITKVRGLPTKEGWAKNSTPLLRGDDKPGWVEWPTVSPVCNGNDGIPAKLDGITVPKWKQESIKAGGNAVVPQVVYQIFKAIESYD